LHTGPFLRASQVKHKTKLSLALRSLSLSQDSSGLDSPQPTAQPLSRSNVIVCPNIRTT
jgi:hypothetical protein